MADYGFLDVAAGETVGELLHAKCGETPTLVHTHPNETVRDAIDILREYGVSQLPVVRAEPPVTAGEVVGSVDEKTLLDALFAGTGDARRPGREAHVAAAADHRLRRAGRRRRRRARRRPTRCWCTSTASRPASSPGRTCSATWRASRLRAAHDQRLQHPRDPRRAGARPGDRRGDRADAPDDHLQAGRRRRAARRLRVQPQRQPDPDGAARGARRARGGHDGAGLRLRASPPRTPCCAPSAGPATTSSSAATPTAARSG